MYSNKEESSAQAAWNAYISTDMMQSQDGLAYVDGSGEDSTNARLIYGIEYVYNFFDYAKWFPTVHYNILATSNYIMDLYSAERFPNTLFYLGACSSYRDSTFNQFLIDHGASCVLGYTAKIQVNCEQSICKHLFEDMMTNDKADETEESRSNFTVEESRDKMYNFLMESLAGYSYIAAPCFGGEATVDASLYGELDFVYEGYGMIEGQVTDENGQGLSDITVKAYRYWDGELIEENTVTTDQDGQYQMQDMPWGMYLMQAHDGQVEDFQQISTAIARYENVDFVLQRVDVRVKVINEDAERLDNAMVVITSEDDITTVLSYNSDDNAYHGTVNQGYHQISVTCEGYEGVNESTQISGSEATYEFILRKTDVDTEGIVYNSHYYKIYAIKSSWEEARDYCTDMGGHLATITSGGEQQAILEYIQADAPDTDLWIGIADVADEGNWSTWVTGEVMNYNNWSPDEPDDGDSIGHDQDYGVICNGERHGETFDIYTGQWDDIANTDNTNHGYFICEWDYIPEGIQ